MAIWAVVAVCLAMIAYLALYPGAWEGMVQGMNFLTGYGEIERLVEEVTE